MTHNMLHIEEYSIGSMMSRLLPGLMAVSAVACGDYFSGNLINCPEPVYYEIASATYLSMRGEEAVRGDMDAFSEYSQKGLM